MVDLGVREGCRQERRLVLGGWQVDAAPQRRAMKPPERREVAGLHLVEVPRRHAAEEDREHAADPRPGEPAALHLGAEPGLDGGADLLQARIDRGREQRQHGPPCGDGEGVP
ncbi:MAG: hypothetical protein ACK55I_09910, partial [bacterium]